MKKLLALLLAVMMVLSTVSFAAPTMVSTNINASELFEVEDVVAETENAELSAEYPGTLIAKVDFEKLDAGYSIPHRKNDKDVFVSLNEVGVNAASADFPALYLRVTGGTLNVAENADGTKYGSWDFTSAGPGWAKIGIYTNGKDAGNKMMPEGQYTLVMKTKWIEGEKNGASVAMPSFATTYTPNDENGQWTNGERNYIVPTNKTLDATTGYTTNYSTEGMYKGQTISTNEAKNFEFLGFGKFAFYLNAGTEYFTSAKIAVDDLELYYEAPNVTVTLDDGNDATENTVLRGIAGYTKFDLSKYVLESNTSKAFTGWKIDGTSTTVSNTYTPATTGEITLVPAYNYYAPGLGFEGPELSSASDLAAKVWNNSGEKPSASNPAFTYDLDTVNGVAIMNVNFNEEGLTFPVITGFNTHLSKQINGTNILNTNAIKGIEYKFRLIAPEGAENPSTYFTSNGLSTKVYFKVNWPADLTETECYGGEGINGWHWGECTGYTKAMLSKGAEYNGDWLTAYIDLNAVTKSAHDFKDRKVWEEADRCSDFRIQFLSDTYVAGDFKLEIDYIRFVLADGLTRVEPELVSYELYDLRKGYIDLTFTEAIEGVPTSDLTALINGPFTAAVDEFINEDGTATYRFYASSSVRGKTLSFNEYGFTADAVVITPAGLKGVTKTYSSAEVADKADGENLVPNGDFETPYFNVFVNDGGALNTEIKDGKLYVTHTDKTAEWNSLVVNDIKIKPNTHYYIEIDATPTQDSKNNPHKDGTTFGETITTYFPVADGMMTLNKNSYTGPEKIGSLDYIPSTTNGFQISMSNLYFKNKFPKLAKVAHIMDADYYAEKDSATPKFFQHYAWSYWNANNAFFDAPKITIQTCISSGKNAGVYVKDAETGKFPDAEGLQYAIDSFVIKEMFPVYLYSGETLLDTYYAAKDVPIILPKSTKYVSESGEAIVGWTDGTKTYAPEELFTLTTASAKTFTAVTENIPVTSKTISIRTDAYKGIRFRASVSVKMKNNENTSEFGYIVTRKELLEAAGLTAENFTADSEVKMLTGTAYIKGSVDKVFENNGSYNYFTAVLYNIPEDQYDDILVARPYLVNNGVKTYGAPIATSLRAAAISVKGTYAYNDLSDEAKAVVDSIVG